MQSLGEHLLCTQDHRLDIAEGYERALPFCGQGEPAICFDRNRRADADKLSGNSPHRTPRPEHDIEPLDFAAIFACVVTRYFVPVF
jgi:hypothetical protein